MAEGLVAEKPVAAAIDAAPNPGKGIAAGQRICTARGPVAVEELARGGTFTAICFDPQADRYLTRTVRVHQAGRRPVVRIKTDRANFELAADQPLLMRDGEYIPAQSLTPGMQLRAATVLQGHGGLLYSRAPDGNPTDLSHLVPAQCAVANWYPTSSLEPLGEQEVFEAEIDGPALHPGVAAAHNLLLWTEAPGGGTGIVVGA